MCTIQKYVRPQSLEEAYQLNQNRRNRILGGMLWLKMGTNTIPTAIDLCDLGLDTIEEDEKAFYIGAMVTLRQIEKHEALNAYACGVPQAAVRDIVGVQFRNMATIGGSIWGRFGFSDVLTAFMAMDCDVELYKGGIVPLAQFAQMKPDRDILVRLIVRKTPAKFAYQTMRNQRTDFPVIACAVSQMNGQTCAVIGARPMRACMIKDEQGILAGGITKESAERFAAYAAEHAPTGSNTRASAQYRTHLIRVLTQRAMMEMGGEQ